MKSNIIRLVLAIGIAGLSGRAFADTGEETFNKKCAMCHGKDGKGQTPMGKKLNIKDLTDDAAQGKKDQELEKTILEGKPDTKMAAFKGKLSGDEIKAVLAHIRSLKKK